MITHLHPTTTAPTRQTAINATHSRTTPATRASSTPVEVDEDAQMLRAFTKGFKVGTPITFLICAGIGLAAGTGIGIAAVIGTWTALIGGWFFGGIFYINRTDNEWAPVHHSPAADHHSNGQ